MKNKWGYQRRKISSDMFILQINYLGENLFYVQAFLSLLKRLFSLQPGAMCFKMMKCVSLLCRRLSVCW